LGRDLNVIKRYDLGALSQHFHFIALNFQVTFILKLFAKAVSADESNSFFVALADVAFLEAIETIRDAMGGPNQELTFLVTKPG
jgi:hypothetical protein